MASVARRRERLKVYADKLERWGESRWISTRNDRPARVWPKRWSGPSERPGLAAAYRVGYMSGAPAFLELLPQTLVDRIWRDVPNTTALFRPMAGGDGRDEIPAVA